MGDSVFQAIAQQLTQDDTQFIRVSEQQYDQWQREFSWHGLTGQRYGQSFCNYFGVTNYVLWYVTDWRRADEIIRNYYIA